MFNSVMKSWTRLILLLLVIRLSAAEEEKNLTGTKGGNITLPDPLLEFGFLIYQGHLIAEVNNGKLYTEETYTKRLRWNKTSGLFTLTDLQKNDSGNFIIISRKGKVFTASYILTVYDSVAPPAGNSLTVLIIVGFFIGCGLLALAAFLIWWKRFRTKTTTPDGQDTNLDSQNQGGNFQDPPGSADNLLQQSAATIC